MLLKRKGWCDNHKHIYNPHGCLLICLDQDFRSTEVAWMLDSVALRWPFPKLLKRDNGSAFAVANAG
mgnify:FL=1